MRRGFARTATALVAATVLALGAAPASAKGGGRAPAPVGYDVSWPQCGQELPSGQAFAIVGVNGGLANNANPCFSSQLAWATASTGGTSQPRAALYVNTANPGLKGSWWPTSNEYPAGAVVANPYGQCTGAEDTACAFMYGYAKAHDDAQVFGPANPEAYFWWLDVEIGNTWSDDTAANRADLEGMTHYFLDVLDAAGVGIYSTGYQWRQIVGSVGPATDSAGSPSSLNGLPSWLAGATSLKSARALCSATPLTGGAVTVTQYVERSLDKDHACPA